MYTVLMPCCLHDSLFLNICIKSATLLFNSGKYARSWCWIYQRKIGQIRTLYGHFQLPLKINYQMCTTHSVFWYICAVVCQNFISIKQITATCVQSFFLFAFAALAEQVSYIVYLIWRVETQKAMLNFKNNVAERASTNVILVVF